MAGRIPSGRAPARGGQCAGPSRGIRNPGLTRAAQLRQAKSAAFVKEQEAKEAAKNIRVGGPCDVPRKARVPKFTRGPPPAEPRRINMTKPAMTKAMLARMKHAEEFTKNLANQRNEANFQRTQRAPTGGDPRQCRQPRQRATPGSLQQASAGSRLRGRKGNACGETGSSTAPGPCAQGPRRGAMPLPQAHSSMRRGRRSGGISGIAEEQPITAKTCELAQSMNADVLQAEPVGEGPVQNIVIPPGAVSQCRTTIVALPHDDSANRSLQLLSESLLEQDALESVTINSRLCELQHARRDFVLAVANVGGNVVNLHQHSQSPCSDQRTLYQLPDPSDDIFQVEYGRAHPTVMAAREFHQRQSAAQAERENQMRIDREFAKVAACEGGLRSDVPMEQEIMEGDISFEEDEDGVIIPCASRIKASMPPIPRKNIAAVPDAIGPEELQRFFDPARYPMPCDYADPYIPPAGRENLHPDLWELDDPWYREITQPDLMDFNSYC
ncbi:uncharacterized protein LOC105688419 [Athalia rosae]|uniref:uncharacterized protein LOC105688419 n=1 Tax=Athalia rosae TaxID=37344 RepID=UPI0020344109|nr:uncharacterized protein LOC105688419 [Athalia rosae]